jgi:hypothetical protein
MTEVRMDELSMIAALLLIVKICLHLYLLSKTKEGFRLMEYTDRNSLKSAIIGLLPFMGVVPKRYSTLKTVINVIYAIAYTGLIIFLIWFNTARHHR